MNLEEWIPYLADVPHLLGNLPWNPTTGMYVASKGQYIPPQDNITTYSVKDFYPVISHRGHDPGVYEEFAKDKDGYGIWVDDEEGNTQRKIITPPMPDWIQRRMNMSFEGQPVDEAFTNSTDPNTPALAGWHYLCNGYEMMDYDHELRDRLEKAAVEAYDARQTLYVLTTNFSDPDALSDDNWWMLFALVPIYPYDRSSDTQRDYRLVSISPYNQLSKYDNQREMKAQSSWKDAPNLNFQVRQKFDSIRLREAVRSKKAHGFTPTAQSIARILHDDDGPTGDCKVWYKVSPFPGIWQSINTQVIENFPVPPQLPPKPEQEDKPTHWPDTHTGTK
jgi:hypothetical protein